MPNQGNHTQKIPPITSVSDKSVSSAAGIFFDPIEYKINPRQTNTPWVANNAWFLGEERKFRSLLISIIEEKNAQIRPAMATVVNLGVSFLHLKDTEKIENPRAAIRPKISPIIDPLFSFPNAIIIIPKAAIKIDIQTPNEIFSFRNKNPNNAVIKGIAAKHNKVIAAEVVVIDQMKAIIAAASPVPPIIPDKPIL